MTSFPVILVQPTCPGDQRAKGVQFQLTCHLYRESHKLEVWLCFLILSFLSTSTCAAPKLETVHLLDCLKYETLRNAIERSEAMLYAPSSSDIKENCQMKSLKCYMSELIMVIAEEEIEDPKKYCIYDFDDRLPPDYPVHCPPCEAYSLKNITVFMERLTSLLQEMKSRTA
ncbi:hypothetical protein EYF80_000089 [Liparis tanakae]|uniref:Interleukin n=1 Tax=Liparis tanakae TaxID=230148 RepID=A0A4Z2JGS2_9TELE|nr:hypothetical protein EYF80_000089 [Liparis tanakae]